MKKRIYADHAADTPVRPEVREIIERWYGNASALYADGRDARKAIENARRTIAELLGRDAGEIFFTSGGTEADNWAVKGTAWAAGRGHILTTMIEHPAVYESCRRMEREGFAVTYLNPDRNGRIRTEDVLSGLRPDTFLISVMTVNNETGVIQPAGEILEIARERHILFHTDAVQAAGRCAVPEADLVSLAAHKFGGPQGVGVLVIRQGTEIRNLMDGGGQERGHRAGTENVAGIVAAAEALKLAMLEQETENLRLTRLQAIFLDKLSGVPGITVTGHAQGLNKAETVPGIVNLRIDRVDGEELTLLLDLDGIGIATGSACTAGDGRPSRILTAMGCLPEEAYGSVRISFGRGNTEEEAARIAARIAFHTQELRKKTPGYLGKLSRYGGRE
jgi:cysteine desulfurase